MVRPAETTPTPSSCPRARPGPSASPTSPPAPVGATLPAGASVSLDLSPSGRTVLNLTSPVALAAGPVELLRLAAGVPQSAPYAAAQALQFSEVSLNGGTIEATGDAGLELV